MDIRLSIDGNISSTADRVGVTIRKLSLPPTLGEEEILSSLTGTTDTDGTKDCGACGKGLYALIKDSPFVVVEGTFDEKREDSLLLLPRSANDVAGEWLRDRGGNAGGALVCCC